MRVTPSRAQVLAPAPRASPPPTPRPCQPCGHGHVVELGDERAARRRDRVADDARADGRAIARRRRVREPDEAELRAREEQVERAVERRAPAVAVRRRSTRDSARRRPGRRRAARARRRASPPSSARSAGRRVAGVMRGAHADERRQRRADAARAPRPAAASRGRPTRARSARRRRRRRRPRGTGRSRRRPTSVPSRDHAQAGVDGVGKRQRAVEAARRLDHQADRPGRAAMSSPPARIRCSLTTVSKYE